MQVICVDGPAEGERHEVPDPPPKTIRVEVAPDDDDDTADPVAEGTGFPTIVVKPYGYRLANDFLSEVVGNDRTRVRTVEYEFDRHLHPEMTDYVT